MNPALTDPLQLPIWDRNAEIVRAIRTHSVVVITGETGSGKTTQLPKMCIEAGQGISGLIGCTQPRRVAAVALAHRLADELGEPIGQTVGYAIRFEQVKGPGQRIKFMTDGVLLAEAQSDPMLRRYDTLIVDEAHERSLNIDLILGILRNLLPRRPDLHLIITSATIDVEKFSSAFDRAPVIELSGRTYPVEIRYAPPETSAMDGEETYVESAVRAVADIATDTTDGDILIFMPTERDIRETCGLLEGLNRGDWTVLPMFSRLSASEQRRIFLPAPTSRKIIVATNVAETSLTIPGIRFVVDTGLARIRQYNPRTRTSGLPVRMISRSSADQRAGRCGRVRNGICVRLYSESDYLKRPPFTPPEILRANLAEVILRMKALNLGEIRNFPFIDRPSPKRIRDGFELLLELGALAMSARVERSDPSQERYNLTPRGRLMARLPLDPRLSRMILEAREEGCLDAVLVIAAGLSIQDPRERPVEKATQADSIHRTFLDPISDFSSMLLLWNHCRSHCGTHPSRSALRRYCREHFLSYRRMLEWQAVHEDLRLRISEADPEIASLAERSSIHPPGGDSQDDYTRIHKAILSGYLSNIALRKEKNRYTATRGREACLFPGSGLFNLGPTWIVAAELVETSRLFARVCARIDPAWIEPLAGPLCRTTYAEPHWDRLRGEVRAHARVSLFGLIIVPRRTVSFGPIDPEASFQVFLRSALLEGNIRRQPPFLRHNLALKERLALIEEKIRRHDILVDDDAILLFYRERLPILWNVRTLMNLIRERGSDDFLRMTEDDLRRKIPDDAIEALFPDEITVAEGRFPLVYRYAPNTPEDGVTLRIPAGCLSELNMSAVDRGCPGLYRDKIHALLKGLPKSFRKRLPPLPETASAIFEEMDRDYDDHLPYALSEFVRRRFGVTIPAAVWSSVPLPEHLRMRFLVYDEDRGEESSDRDLDRLRHLRFFDSSAPSLERLRNEWERDPVSAWDFPDLPDRIPLIVKGKLKGYAYPVLEACEDRCRLSLLTDVDGAAAARIHRLGVSKLLSLQLGKELLKLRKLAAFPPILKKQAALCGGSVEWERRIYRAVVRDLFEQDIRTREAFSLLLDSLPSRWLPRLNAVMTSLEPVLSACFETTQALIALETTNRSNRPALAFIELLRAELSRLIPDDFLERYSAERIAHLPRYLTALILRGRRGLNHLERALKREAEIAVYTDRLREFEKSVTPETPMERRRLIESLFWMIEEYKVSVFAQELKTPSPVSPKRLREKIEAIEGDHRF